MRLIIFDLDQTLVDFVQLHNDVTHRMLKKYFGIEAWLTEVEYAGRSQRDGMRDLAELKGVPGQLFDSRIDELLGDFGAEFAASMPAEVSQHILPGARDLLERLSRTENVLVLYTGDAPGVAEAVLHATGLVRYFAYQFYGTQLQKREDMVRLAVEKAGAATGHRFKGKSVVIIGDSIRELECGRIFNALTIGVATGHYSASELAEAGADVVVQSLQESRTILDAIDRSIEGVS